MKPNQIHNSFDNILLTLKKYSNDTYELLYISSEIRGLINGDSKFFQESFFEHIFPTLPKPIFNYLFKALGNGDKFSCPILIKNKYFQWVKIEGYVISQEDNSYLINALISPQAISSDIPFSWLITDGQTVQLTRNNGYDLDWEKLIGSRFPFLDQSSLDTFKNQEGEAYLCIFPNRLYLTKRILGEKVFLIQLEYHNNQTAMELGLPNPQESNLVYYELDVVTGEMILTGAVENVLGYQTEFFENFTQSRWRKLIHPDDDRVYDHGFEHSKTIVYKFLHADGHYIFLQDEIEKLSQEDRENKHLKLGVIGDISELKEIEKNLLDNKSILDELTGVVPGIVYMLKSFPDGTHQYIFISEGSRELAGLEPKEILEDEKSFEALILREDINQVLQADRDAYNNNQKFESQFRIKTKDGQIKWIYGASNRLEKYQNQSIWAGLFIDITQSKIKEEEALLQQLKYKLLFDENPVPIFQYDRNGNILTANQAFLSNIGLVKESEVKGQNLFELIGDQPIRQAYIDSIQKGSGFYEGPYISYFSKKLFHLRVNAKPIDNDSFQAILENITEQEYIQNILAELTERTSKFSGTAFFDQLTLFLSEKLGTEYCFISEVDDSLEKAEVISMFKNGEKQENFIYEIANSPCEHCLQSSSPLIILNDASKLFPKDEELVKLNISTYMGVTISDINNKNLGMLVLMNTKPVQYSPAYETVLKILADRIGAELSRINYERLLINSEMLFRSIAENFPKGTVEVLDTDFTYVYTDGKEYHQQGINPNDLIGKSIISRYSEEIGDKIKTQLEKVLAGESVMFEMLIDQQQYLKSGVPLKNEQNQIDRVLLVTQNITETKKAEEERNQLIKDLKSQNEELQRFAYIISHNLRAPIVNITALLDLYNSIDPEDPENIEVIDNLKTATGILNNTLQDLIDVVAIKKNKLPKIEKIDFKMLSSNIETSLSKQIEESGAVITKDFSSAPSINYIYSHLENFLTNLTTNAIKYRKPDEDLQIGIKTYEDGEYMVIEFKDNGIGIDLERYGDRLFGLYQRFHSHVEGKGLGLYLVREQIRAHDGNLHVESEVGKGTIFYIYLKNLIVNTEDILTTSN